MTVMATGKEVTIDEINATLGKEIHMYRLSTYIWLMKTNANAVVKAIKNGRKITAYQIVNVADVKKYLKDIGSTSFTPGQSQKIVKWRKTKAAAAPKVAKLKDLKAESVTKAVTEEVMKVTEVTEKELGGFSAVA
jgi:hypothetical protein